MAQNYLSVLLANERALYGTFRFSNSLASKISNTSTKVNSKMEPHTADASALGTRFYSVLKPIAPPILGFFDAIEVANFLKEHERYQVEIKTKRIEAPSLKMLPYAASIDCSPFKSMHSMGKFDTMAPEIDSLKTVSDKNIKSFI